MQASAQDLSAMLGNLVQGPVATVASPGQAQPIGIAGESAGTDFLASLEASLQALAQGQQSPIVPFDPAQLLAALEQSFEGQQQAMGGNGLPLEALVAAAGTGELTPELQALMNQLQQAASVGAVQLPAVPAVQSALQNKLPLAARQSLLGGMNMVMTPVMADGEVQALAEQRRLFERFQSLPEVRLGANDLSANALRQSLGQLEGQSLSQSSASFADAQESADGFGSANGDLASAPVTQKDDFALQMARMTELKNVALSSKEGAVLDSLVKSDLPDMAPLTNATQQRPVTPSIAGDARPTQTFVHVPLNDPQWQNEFSNRVTWLARAGGNPGNNQSAEIRLNPANMGPIEVRVVMNDDQATITFTAQHGVVRDAIEASLPRLREMFMGSGLQLAQANVSDQPLHEQRQRQQQGFGSGHGSSRGSYEQIEGIGDLVSPVALSMLHSTALADRLDLYA